MGLTENGVPADNDDSILTDCNSIQSYNVPCNSGPVHWLFTEQLNDMFHRLISAPFQIYFDHNPWFLWLVICVISRVTVTLINNK